MTIEANSPAMQAGVRTPAGFSFERLLPYADGGTRRLRRLRHHRRSTDLRSMAVPPGR